jgi:hypothetical protein
MQVTGRGMLPKHRAHWGKLVLVWMGIATAAAACALVALILIMGDPSHRGASRSASHVTTN